MSGGSYDYAYSRVESMAYDMLRRGNATPLRQAFAEHLLTVSAAMRAVEWVDSKDWAESADEEPMRKALGQNAPALELMQAIKQAQQVQSALGAALLRAQATLASESDD